MRGSIARTLSVCLPPWFRGIVGNIICLWEMVCLSIRVCHPGWPYWALRWRHNERYGVSNHQRLDCSLDRLLRRRSKKTSNLRVTGLCEGNSPVTGEFPAQMVSNVEYVSIWWRHHRLDDQYPRVQARHFHQTLKQISLDNKAWMISLHTHMSVSVFVYDQGDFI